MNKAIFLDRDGTINVEIHYLHEPDKFEFIKGVPEALKQLKQKNFELIVITNQGAVGRGMYTHQDVKLTHKRMIELLRKKQIKLSGIYYCPHASNEKCACRKPQPGMLNKAIKDFNIDVSQSWMIGDKLSDIEAGKNAKLKTILVMTGYGNEHRKILENIPKDTMDYQKKKPDYFAEDLLAASELIISLEK